MIKIFGGVVDNHLPRVETNRLVLRKRTLADAEDMFAYAHLDSVAQAAGFPRIRSLEQEITYFTQVFPQEMSYRRMPIGYGITLKGIDRVIGSIDFINRLGPDILEIGYVLHPTYWGRGIAPEAVSAFIEVAFGLLNLYKLEASCYSSNEQSQSVLRKCGFSLEACLRGRHQLDDARIDDLRYGLLKSDWARRRERASYA